MYSRSGIGKWGLWALVHALPSNFMILVPKRADFPFCSVTTVIGPCLILCLPFFILRTCSYDSSTFKSLCCCSARSAYRACVKSIPLLFKEVRTCPLDPFAHRIESGSLRHSSAWSADVQPIPLLFWQPCRIWTWDYGSGRRNCNSERVGCGWESHVHGGYRAWRRFLSDICLSLNFVSMEAFTEGKELS